MNHQTVSSKRSLQEGAVIARFLDVRDDASFDDLFKTFTPQLVAFFRARGHASIAEDVAQEVMFMVYRKADQVRDRSLFRAWIFKIARHALSRQYSKRSREITTVDIADVPARLIATNASHPGTPAFEFNDWMAFLETREREALTLRFIEDWEYHEIASAQNTPIGTVQWRVFNAKRKLAPLLQKTERASNAPLRRAA